jgi:hypothetical protein
VHFRADGAYSGMLSCVLARIARPRRIEAPIESLGSESTLNLSQAESVDAVRVADVSGREHPVTTASVSAVSTTGVRFIAG